VHHLRGLEQGGRVQLVTGWQPAAALAVDQQDALEHAVIGHQILGGGHRRWGRRRSVRPAHRLRHSGPVRADGQADDPDPAQHEGAPTDVAVCAMAGSAGGPGVI